MNQDYLRSFARRCRELLVSARTERAKEQLRLWAEEFEARAERAGHEAAPAEPGADKAGR